MISPQADDCKGQVRGEWVETIPIEKVVIDLGTQSRAAINGSVVEEYSQDLQAGALFPPVEVVFDGEQYILWDGFHRFQAAEKAGRSEVEARVRKGTLRDALLLSVGANAAHGLRRTNLDKRRAVLLLLNDSEWSLWSNVEIAKRAAVSEHLVRTVRDDLSSPKSKMQVIQRPTTQRKVTRFGTIYDMSINGIGRNGKSNATPTSVTPPLQPETVKVEETEPTDLVVDANRDSDAELEFSASLEPSAPEFEVTVVGTIPFSFVLTVENCADPAQAIEVAKERLWNEGRIMDEIDHWRHCHRGEELLSLLQEEDRKGKIHYEVKGE